MPASASRPSLSAVIVEVCGAATARGSTLLTGADAMTCFLRALSSCTPASLQLRDLSVDTGTDHDFTILGGSPCRVSDDNANYVAPHTPGPPRSDVCTAAQQAGTSFVLRACGAEGDITLPTPA